VIRWPIASAKAIARLFRAIQDLDIYVEDQGDEQFYTVLMRTAAPQGMTIKRVVGLGGREAVLHAAANYLDSKPALFLIDGDLPLVRGDSAPNVARLARLDCYCVENLVINRNAAGAICCDEAMCDSDEGVQILDYQRWCSAMMSLVPLCIRFAILNGLDPSRVTVADAFHRVVTADARGLPSLDMAKVQGLIAVVETEIDLIVGQQTRLELLDRAERHVETLKNPLHAVSGKNFLLPLLHFQLKRISGTKITKSSFRYRLATKCSIEDVLMLRNAIDIAA
jgi:hypothetical protein